VDNGKRRTRFEGRVQLEREFLTPVNAAFGSIEPLAGMTKGAIESWKRRVGTKTEPKTVDKIAKILFEASFRAHLLADNSKDVFEPEHRPKPESIAELRSLLEKALAGIEPLQLPNK
jgi:hypothetical protein